MTNIAENKGVAWPQLLESTSHLWGAKKLVLCISEPYIERKVIACKLAIVNYYNNLKGVAEVWKEVNTRFLRMKLLLVAICHNAVPLINIYIARKGS